MSFSTALLPADLLSSPALLETLLDVSLTGVIFFTPVYATDGTNIVDLAYVHLNPAAQKMLELPPRPAHTFLTLYPNALQTGIFAFYRDTFLSGKAGRLDVNYSYDGLDNYFNLAAQPSGAVLVVSFTNTSDRPPSAVEEALRQSQAAEKAARAEAELQRQRFYDLLMQLPAHVAVHEGPDQVFTLVNPYYQRLAPGRDLLGQPIREAWPELVSQGILNVLDGVYHTGEPFVGTELPLLVDFTRTGHPEQVYYNAFFLPLRDARDQILGVLDFSYDVTGQVLARQQVEGLNRELAAANEELLSIQQTLQALNEARDARVQERTGQLQQAQARMLEAAHQQDRERENFYQVFEQAPVIVALLRGPEHFLYYRNPAFQALFPGRELTGHFYADVMPEIVAAGLMAELDRVYATRQTYYGTELPVITTPPDGSAPHERFYDFSYQAYRENGEIVGISIFAYDVTSRVETRQIVESQRGELQRVFEQAPVAICVFRGASYVLEVVNPPMGQMLGRPLTQLVGKPFFEAMPELIGQGLEELLHQVQQTGIAYVAQEQAVQLAHHPPGTVGYYNFVYQPLYNEYGLITGITCIATQVTDQVLARQQVERLNQELAAANEELQAANEEILSTNEELGMTNSHLTRTNGDLDNFIYTASHDLKAPITNIEGLMQNLWRTLPAEALAVDRVKLIRKHMQDSVERFQRTIANLTEVVKLQKENSAEAVLVNLSEVVREVSLDLEPMLGATHAQLAIDLSDCPAIRFSEKNLRSVVYNLISNALKYRSPERVPQVRIGCQSTPIHHVLTVSDNGLGMEPSRLNQLFTMFKRFHDHVEGSGIGLYMIKKMVENGGGKIEVASQVGMGSTFRVYFPR